ncbi:MAG: SH3 domain-containing protein [Clostridia bacterium]|nr:SH3 domain-containing protein [Clostridia bacterium]
MKKLLALLLAILMIATVALVSCNNKKGTTGGNADEGANTEEDNGLVIPNGVGSSDTTDAGSDSTDTSDAGNQGGNNQTSSGIFVDVATQFSVYTYTTTKIRASAMMKAAEVTTVEASAQLTVVAKNETWYKVKYGADEGYVLQDFVTANKDDTIFTDFNEADYKTVQIKGDADNINKVYIRQYPIIADDYLDQVRKDLTYAETSNGELLKIGVNETGTWYKVSYNNEIYYLAITSVTKPHLIVDGQPLTGSSQGGI